jgi:hypothetical protein
VFAFLFNPDQYGFAATLVNEYPFSTGVPPQKYASALTSSAFQGRTGAAVSPRESTVVKPKQHPRHASEVSVTVDRPGNQKLAAAVYRQIALPRLTADLRYPPIRNPYVGMLEILQPPRMR